MAMYGGTCAALAALADDEGDDHAHGHGHPRGEAGGADAPRPARFGWLEGTTPVPPRDDGRVRHGPLLRELGLDGLIDAHSHWFPESVMRKIWDYFDRHYWPITYRQLPEGRLEWVRRNKVQRFTTLNYAHRPNMAAWLNEWTAEFCARTPEAIPCGTFFAEPQAPEDVRRCIEDYGFRGFKLHLRVSDLDPTLPQLAPAFEQIEAAGLPVVIHCGSAPEPGRFTEPTFLRALLARHPALRVVVAHMGAWECDDYLALAEQHPTLYLDTTMVFVGFATCDPFPPEQLARMEAISHKVLFGSDFPNIPYPLSHAVGSIGALPLSREAKRRILYDNAAVLFGLRPA
ncbi:MAG TPA: amidohydrolase family protein [bacterium]|nr:amidohydrolase family protein [bacterium]